MIRRSVVHEEQSLFAPRYEDPRERTSEFWSSRIFQSVARIISHAEEDSRQWWLMFFKRGYWYVPVLHCAICCSFFSLLKILLVINASRFSRRSKCSCAPLATGKQRSEGGKDVPLFFFKESKNREQSWLSKVTKTRASRYLSVWTLKIYC